ILLRPVPFLVQLFREREGILQALDVAAGAGIAIPVPRPANAAAGFVNPCRESELPQPMQHVQAGKARADHDGVKLSRFGMTRCARLSHGRSVPSVFLVAFPATRLGRVHGGRQARRSPGHEWHLCCASVSCRILSDQGTLRCESRCAPIPSLRAKRSNPYLRTGSMDCFVASPLAMPAN